MKLFKLFSLMAIAAIAVSCSNDDSSSLGQGNSVQAGFVLSLEDRLATRAISDASGVDQLVYAVYDADGNAVVKKQTVKGLDDVQSGHEVSLPLLYNKTYTAVFWAQNSACSAYTISDDMELTVNYSGNNNDETRDAFF
ncbi:MAG: FimB/Mfa2 family fimbrial subunit, partial [Bacteroidaceae bacterium]|nr:FimB/Mfa2 family fimbrial subunit [Bacteroidaceae bacterium]